MPGGTAILQPAPCPSLTKEPFLGLLVPRLQLLLLAGEWSRKALAIAEKAGVNLGVCINVLMFYKVLN